MFLKPEKLGLTNIEIDKICEELWSKVEIKRCPDCGVLPGLKHEDGCDVAICTICGQQCICCDCEEGECEPGEWTGIWPGVAECYEHKLICYDTCKRPDGTKLGWGFDLNEYAINTYKYEKS